MKVKKIKSSAIAKKRMLAYQKNEKKKGRDVSAKKLIVVAALLTCTSCSIGGQVGDGWQKSCQGRGCDMMVEEVATIISETKLKDSSKSPFFTNQKERIKRKTLLESWLGGSNDR